MKTLRIIPLTLLAFTTAATVSAQDTTVESPALKVGDSWLYDDVTETGPTAYNESRQNLVVERLNADTMTVGIKHEGAPTAFEDHVVGMDWSQRRLVDGQQAVTTKPFEFPLNIGRKWTVDYVDATRRGNQLSSHVRRTYSVAGWTDITVPAGHFHAIEVVADGVDEATIAVPAMAGSAVVASNGGSTSMSHAQRGGVGKIIRPTHAEFYYVPALKNVAKSIEEQYNTDNVRLTRLTRTLITFTPST